MERHKEKEREKARMQLEQKEFWDGIMVNYEKTLHLLL